MGCQQSQRRSIKESWAAEADTAKMAEAQKQEKEALSARRSYDSTVTDSPRRQTSTSGRANDLSSDKIRKLLKVMKGHVDQTKFWDVWAKYIHDKVDSQDNPQPITHSVFVGLDMRYLEIQTRGDRVFLEGLLCDLLNKVGCCRVERTAEQPADVEPPSDQEKAGKEALKRKKEEDTLKQALVDSGKLTPDEKRWSRNLEEMRNLLNYMRDERKSHHKDGEVALTLWCRFKHIRSNTPRPAVDFGFLTRKEHFHWSLLDVMLHPHADQDLLRNFVMDQARETRAECCPRWYGSSLLPQDPEKMLFFEIDETAVVNYKQIVLQAFFFFKAIGLMKPEDAIVKILQKAGSSRVQVHSHFGPNGLVSMSLRLTKLLEKSINRDDGVTSKSIREELAKEMGLTFEKSKVDEIENELGGSSDIIDYVAEPIGYRLRMGWTFC